MQAHDKEENTSDLWHCCWDDSYTSFVHAKLGMVLELAHSSSGCCQVRTPQGKIVSI